ncbi:MAG: murein biosynthesis integral membrane protein MurJ [Alphaproteobacteria bacterium GM7ARS4]|nr:murein biosynthesis integral membrane protein MurJ [Alphaproteobacteria bacterium GM7ARS4]
MSFLRRFLAFGAATMVSRVFGMGRDVLFATSLGASALTDAFLVAFRLPNFFRRFFAEGAFSQSFVPVFVPMLSQDERRGMQFALSVGFFLSVIVGVIVVVLSLFADHWLGWLVPALTYQESTYLFAVDMLRIMLPFLWCMALVSWQVALLHAHQRFGLSACLPIVMNLFMILALSLGAWRAQGDHDTLVMLAWGVTLSGVAQVALASPFSYALWSAHKDGMAMPRWSQDIGAMLRLAVPSALTACVHHVNVVMNTLLATLLPAGSVTMLYYADRVSQLPLGIIGVAASTVILPSLASSHASIERDGQGVQHSNRQHDEALHYSMLLAVPSAAGLFVLASPIIEMLFVYGDFTSQHGHVSAQCLQIFACGVPAFILSRLLVSFFYARKQHHYPLRSAMWSVVVNAFFAFMLMHAYGIRGLAAAPVLASWFQALLLFWWLHGKGWFVFSRKVFSLFVMALSASAVMVVCLLWFERLMLFEREAWFIRFAHVFLMVFVGVLCYGVVWWLQARIMLSDDRES